MTMRNERDVGVRYCVRCGAIVMRSIDRQLPPDTGLCGKCWNDDKS